MFTPMFVLRGRFSGTTISEGRDRKKAGEIVETVQNQKDGRQIAPSRSPLKDLSVYGEVDDLTAVSDGYGKSDAHLPRFFRSLTGVQLCVFRFRLGV